MTTHTCHGIPDAHGRILPECIRCHEMSYAEGLFLGSGATLNTVLSRVEKHLGDHPVELLEGESMEQWRFSKRVLDILRPIVHDLDAQATERYQRER